MLRDGFRHAVEHALQVIQLACELHLHDDNLAFAVDGLDVYAVELVRCAFLVAFAFQDFGYRDFLAEQHGYQPFEHGEVRLVAQHTLHGPVKTDVFIVYLHCCLFYKNFLTLFALLDDIHTGSETFFRCFPQPAVDGVDFARLLACGCLRSGNARERGVNETERNHKRHPHHRNDWS